MMLKVHQLFKAEDDLKISNKQKEFNKVIRLTFITLD